MTEEHFHEHLQQVIPDDEEVEVDPIEDRPEDQLQDDEGGMNDGSLSNSAAGTSLG